MTAAFFTGKNYCMPVGTYIALIPLDLPLLLDGTLVENDYQHGSVER